MDEETSIYAAQGGHLECLRFAHENGSLWCEDICIAAAEGGHLECLQFAYEMDLSEHTCHYAAWGGHLECLRFAHENGCLWDEDTCSTTSVATRTDVRGTKEPASAENGHLECLRRAPQRVPVYRNL